MLLLLLATPTVLAQDILINEVYYDAPTGADEGTSEWVELCNPTTSTIDLSGWMLESAGSSWSESWTFPSGTTLAPGAYLAFGPGVGGASEFNPNLQNGGSETDGVRLVTSTGAVIDTVLYDTNNTNGLLDDRGSAKGPFAPDVSAGSALARVPDCTETTNTGDDFVEVTELTPGMANPSPADCTLAEGAAVLINEFMANPAGSDGDNEWVELYNPGTVDADLSGWLIQGGTDIDGFSEELPPGTILPAGGYLIIGGPLAIKGLGMAPDVEVDFSLGNASSNADGILIADCGGVIYDTVVYGPSLSKDDGWLDDTGGTPTLAPKPGDGESIGRLPSGVDTDDIAADFVALPFPSPWEANDKVGSCPGEDAVKINEFMPNPDSDTSSEDDSREWVELYNASGEDVDLTGWELQWGTSSYSGTFRLPEGTVISAGGFLVIGGVLVAEADVVVPKDADLAMGAATSSLDAVRLLHCGPGLADTVIYGPDGADNAEEWTDDSGALVSGWGPKAVAGESIARRSDGVDTDDSATDFVVSAAPSPGSANPVVACAASDGSIKINEIFPNPASTDSGNEWVELYNAGSSAVSLDAWSIQSGSSTWATKFTFPPESTIEPGQFLLIAEDLVPSEVVDFYTETNLSLGNASSGLDGVRLVDCPGTVADTLLYGKSGGDTDPDEEAWATDDLGGTSYALFPDDDNTSIGRYPDGEDTDDSSVDFASGVVATPGLPNSAPDGGGGGGDGGEPSGKGCSKSAEDTEGSGKCSALSPLASSPLWVLPLFSLLRRRSRRQPAAAGR